MYTEDISQYTPVTSLEDDDVYVIGSPSQYAATSNPKKAFKVLTKADFAEAMGFGTASQHDVLYFDIAGTATTAVSNHAADAGDPHAAAGYVRKSVANIFTASQTIGVATVGNGGLILDTTGTTNRFSTGFGEAFIESYTPLESASKRFYSCYAEGDNTGGNPRKNVVRATGYNVHAQAVARDPTDHAFGDWLETCWGPAGSENVEWYMQGKALDGTVRRPIGITFARSNGEVRVDIGGGNIYLTGTTPSGTATVIAGGPLDMRAGAAGNNGSMTYTLYHSTGIRYLTADPNYGLYWDLRWVSDGAGISVWASATQTSDLFYGQKNSVKAWAIGPNGQWKTNQYTTHATVGTKTGRIQVFDVVSGGSLGYIQVHDE